MKNRLVLLMICMLLVLPKVEIIAEEKNKEEVGVEVKEYTSSPINPRLIATNTPNADGFVVRLYRLCLHREADLNGFMHWRNRILNKKESGTSLVLKFFNSNEYLQRNTSDSDFVESLYQIALNRKAEPKGKIYWLNQITSYSREDIIKQFCASNEFKVICQRYNIVLEIEDPIASFVKRMYEKTLMRSASASEIEGWRNPLAQKQKTAANLVEAFFFSAELQRQNISKEEFVRRAYATLLNRAARNDEVQYWVGKLNEGNSQKQVLYGF
ncbi:MAG: DUF4214 domain-containing protein, partial [Solobacterium sp.]|nr:DUF4214 domain-containing protein [Solobacterium sp.]